jgi:hypothetical protein
MKIPIVRFYIDGFKQMTIGKSLWLIIAIKLLIMFGLFKLFLMRDFLSSRFETDTEKSSYVKEQLFHGN